MLDRSERGVSVAGVFDWRSELSALHARLGELFVRSEPRRQAGLYLEGLLSAVERKNGWQLAEHLGDARPWRTQRLLSHVQWDEEAARDLCRGYSTAPTSVLRADDAGGVGNRSAVVRGSDIRSPFRLLPSGDRRSAGRTCVAEQIGTFNGGCPSGGLCFTHCSCPNFSRSSPVSVMTHSACCSWGACCMSLQAISNSRNA